MTVEHAPPTEYANQIVVRLRKRSLTKEPIPALFESGQNQIVMNDTSDTTTVYLLRHAQSTASADIAVPDWPLSQLGSEQSLGIVDALNALDLDHVYSSPYKRAIDTIKPYCTGKKLNTTIEDDLRERNLTDSFVTQGWDQMMVNNWDDLNFATTNGESGYSCQHRIATCILQIVTRHRGKTLLISSHGYAISLFLNMMDHSFVYQQWKAMKNPDLFKIDYDTDAPKWDKSFSWEMN